MSWKSQLRSDSLQWLLESDNPGVRYLALRDLLDMIYMLKAGSHSSLHIISSQILNGIIRTA